MKKNLKHIGLLLISFSLFACSNEWEAPADQPSHHLVFSSEMDYENKVQVGGEITFGDISTGIKSRTWTLPEAGVSIVEGENGTSSSAEIVKLRFDQSGEFEIGLSQTFEGNAYVGDAQVGSSYDTTFNVTVLDSIRLGITAQYVNPDGSLGEFLNISEGALNEVIASRTVRYYYTALGEPANLNYKFGGGNPAEVSYDTQQILAGESLETDVKYTRMGDHSVTFIGNRERPSGIDTLLLENLIRVVASTEPVTLDDVQEIDDKVALVFSREIDAASISDANFSVKIVNGDLEINPTISAVGLKPNEGNVVLISLGDEKLYSSDVVTVTYTPGSMKTTDGVLATAFEENIRRDLVNIVDATAAGFENAADGWVFGGWWGNPGSFEASQEVVRSGNYSLHVNSFTGPAGEEGHTCFVYDMATPVQANVNYQVTFWLNVVSSTPHGTLGFSDFRMLVLNDWGNAVIVSPDNTDQFTPNTWVKVTANYKSAQEDAFRLWFRSIGDTELYIDDLEIVEFELRPTE
ncbi:hypothetical protein [Sediminitomix flava]|uniref:Ig-like domain-containing protein n=1 Tax=Sediminitomix flava TaxID=379075 RepID=A0A315Z5W4_SEDFL|nr:hypothetical protein [Sediminitomix flava]PWJ37966.1 hypothetical protein BC781_108101 [Sediminitomix flava]